jgi:CheY-like chemotaxis protein
MTAQPIILIVEDNPDDALLLRRAFVKAKLLNPIHFVSSAEEAVAYLISTGKYQNRTEFPLPALILLDLKMPGMSGHGFLAWLRAQPAFQTLRVVVLSDSDDLRDVSLAYQLGANSFLTKPADFDRFVEISSALNGHWFCLDKSPDPAHPSLALAHSEQSPGRLNAPGALPLGTLNDNPP